MRARARAHQLFTKPQVSILSSRSVVDRLVNVKHKCFASKRVRSCTRYKKKKNRSRCIFPNIVLSTLPLGLDSGCLDTSHLLSSRCAALQRPAYHALRYTTLARLVFSLYYHSSLFLRILDSLFRDSQSSNGIVPRRQNRCLFRNTPTRTNIDERRKEIGAHAVYRERKKEKKQE